MMPATHIDPVPRSVMHDLHAPYTTLCCGTKAHLTKCLLRNVSLHTKQWIPLPLHVQSRIVYLELQFCGFLKPFQTGGTFKYQYIISAFI